MDHNFSPQQSLALIETMIGKAKVNLSENRFYFLLWGWYAFIAMLTQFMLKVIVGYEYHYLVWVFTVPLAIVTMVRANKQTKKQGARTYVGESMSYLWSGVGISFFVLSVIITVKPGGWLYCYPFFILLYGLGTYISGRIIQFSPLVIGGVFNWLLACVSAFLPFDYQLLCGAAAILTSYIIPGHLLAKYKN